MFPGRLRNVHGLTQNNEPHNTDYQINDNLQIFQIEVKFFPEQGAGSRAGRICDVRSTFSAGVLYQDHGL